jgi:hypothetical protein
MLKLPDSLCIALNQAGVEIATFYPATETWNLVTRPEGKRTETEIPNAALGQTLVRLAAGDKIEGQQTTGTRG